jgi:hypothetical protein
MEMNAAAGDRSIAGVRASELRGVVKRAGSRKKKKATETETEPCGHLLLLQEVAIVGGSEVELEIFERLALAQVVVILRGEDSSPPA